MMNLSSVSSIIRKEDGTSRTSLCGRVLLLSSLLFLSPGGDSLHAQEIGTWTNYLSYADVQDACEAGNCVFVRASNDLYKYNRNDQSITTYDKVNGLSDNYITHIKWNTTAKRLVIVYENSNIDLMDLDGDVQNVSDLYSKAMTEDKTVNHVCIYNRWAFLSTNFGVVRLNMKDGNISETYKLGKAVERCQVADGYVYAATASGTLRASLDANLMDKSQWETISGYTVPTDAAVDSELLALVNTLQPGGPINNNFNFLKIYGSKLYSVGGAYTVLLAEQQKPGYVQTYENGTWTTYGRDVEATIGHQYRDMVCLTLDPTSTTEHLFVGGRTGLYEYENGAFKQEYTIDNSPLKGAQVGSTTLGKDYTLVEGITFDSEGNLWALNSQSGTTNLLEYTKDRQWVSHYKSDLMVTGSNYSFPHMIRPIFDSRNLLWFVSEYYTCPYLMRYNKTSDELKVYKTFTNTDGTTQTVGYVSCVREDRDNNIWVGTSAGPFYLTPSDISSDSETFNQYKVARDDGSGLADYLLSGVYIQDIAIDGGNRKWFATSGNGVYLISSDNNTQIQHFTSDNSPLLSNSVTSIAIDGETGIVYFATDKGLCSYKSDATDPSDGMEKDKVYAYPNPTTPGYEGLITVNGLSQNADVKIVSVNGSLIAEGRSTGGTFTWNGCDKSGRKVNSGIYMVVTAASDGSKGTVCKIAIVR